MTTMQIKKLNQQLERIIPDNERQSVLVENKTYNIEVLEEELRTFRIPVKDMLSPAKITFSYERFKTQNPLVKPTSPLHVFLSLTNKEPRRNQCDFHYQAPPKVTIDAPHKAKKFECLMVYMSLYSPSNCFVQIKVDFYQKPKKSGIEWFRKIKHDPNEDSGEDPFEK